MTYKMDDLLDAAVMNKPNRDIKFIERHEIRSPTFGKCFTLKVTKEMSLNEPFFLILNRTWDLTIFVHNDGEEFWLAWLPYGPLINKFQLNIKSNTEAVTTVLSLAEKQFVYYSKIARPCNKTNSGHNRNAVFRDAADYRSSKRFKQWDRKSVKQ